MGVKTMDYPYKWVSKAMYDFLAFIGKVYLLKNGDYIIVGQNKEMILPFEWGEKLRQYEMSLDE